MPSLAATSGFFNASVDKILLDQGEFGGCMARLSVNPATVAGVTCKNNWVSMGCTGEFVAKDIASRFLAGAQLALVTGTNASFKITDDSTYNNYCTVVRIDNSNVSAP